MKLFDPVKWIEKKQRDAEKKRRNYKKISELSETEKAMRREVWRKLKQKNCNKI